MAGVFAILGKIKQWERMRDWALETQAERQHPPAEQPRPQPQTAEPRSTEDRFWSFFARVNPHLLPPWHFRIYVRRLLRAVGGDLRLAFAAPPQHGKSETTLALLAFLVLEHPGKRWAYVTYNQKRANNIARKFRRILANAGEVAAGTLAVTYIAGGGQILFTSIDGGITGEPVDGAVFIDDPYKNRKEADSQQRRAVIEETYREAIETRVHPGASIFLLATRWHPDDLTGVLVAGDAANDVAPWECINLPAIAENDNDPNGRQPGEALFPEKWPIEALQRKRSKVLEFAWQALYQGRPRPRGGKIFHEPTFFKRYPEGYRGAYGIDLAFTAKTTADWSVCVELLREERPRGEEPVFYVRMVNRAQVEAPEFTLTLRARHIKHPNWRMLWRASGTEKGSASFIREKQIPLEVKNPPGDKLVAATPVAEAWNAGRIQVPDPDMYPAGSREREELEAWLYPFLDIVRNFTGSGKEKDDDVDALGNAFEALRVSADDGGLVRVRSDRH